MNIKVETYGHAAVLNIEGELTEDTLGAFRREVQRQLASDDVIDVVLNLEKVPFIDSAALEYLLEVQEQLAIAFGQIKLTNPDENIRTILEMTRLAAEFDVYDEVTAAVKAIQA
jgi:anti-anti-sigma factor